jgi:hypothetical protein
MQTWDENVINKVGHSASENVFSVHFYDSHVPTFPRKKLSLYFIKQMRVSCCTMEARCALEVMALK